MMGVNVGSVIAQLKLDSSQFNIAINTAQQRMNGFAKSMQRIGAYLTIGLTAPLVLYGKKAVKAFADFDDAIVRSAAVTRDMNLQMRLEMEKTAIQMSRKSLFSATELAGGYFALGQAGYSAAQSIKALPVVEKFAIASTTDLDTAVRYLSRTIQGLGMASEDPVEMMKSMQEVADAFTFASITTTAEIEDFAIAMTHAAAPALKMVNKSMEEGTAVLMAFALAGIQAEEAGTLLWTTIRDLQRANITARKEWLRFGLTVYDSEGKMRNLADIFGDIENRFAGLSDESKKATLTLLGFQDRSLRGIQALMGFSEEIRAFEHAMTNMDNLTEKVAETYKKSFSAQITMAKNTIHSLGVEIGFYLSPIIANINSKIQQLAKWWDTLSDNSKLVIVEIGIMLAVMGPLLIIISKLIMSVTILSFRFGVLGKAIFSLVASFLVVTVAATAWLALGALLVAIAYTLRAAWIQGMDTIKERMVAIGELLRGVWEQIYTGTTVFITAIKNAFTTLFDYLNLDFNSFVSGIMAELIGAKTWVVKMSSVGKEAWQAFTKAWESGDYSREAFMNAMGDIVEGSKEAGKAAANAFYDMFKDVYKNKRPEKFVIDTYKAVELNIEALGGATKEHLIELGDALKKQFGEDVAGVTTLITEKIKKMNDEFLQFLPDKDLQEIVASIDVIKKKAEELQGTFVDTDMLPTLKKTFDEMQRALDQELETLQRTQQGEKRVTELIQLRAIAEDAAIEKSEEFLAIQKKYKKTLEDIEKLHRFDNLANWFNDNKSEEIWGNFADNATSALDSLSSTLTDFISGQEVDWKQFTASILKMFLESLVKMQVAAAATALFDQKTGIITKLVTSAVSSLGSLGSSSGDVSLSDSGISSSTMSPGATHMPGYALGGVFNAGEIIPMALGGLLNSVVNSPTLAPMSSGRTALMGEAGPEGVLPLKRDSSGRLGVHATTPKVNVENKLKIINVETEEQYVAALNSDAGEKVIMNKLRKFGVIR